MSAPDLRDRGLRRVSRLTGWLAAAGLVAVGAFAGLLARPQPSSAKVSTAVDPATAADQTPTTTSGKSSGSSAAKSGSSQKASPPITAPRQPPVQSRQRGPAVSGGS